MLKFYVKVFYVMGKALSGELSCPCDRSCFFFLQNKACVMTKHSGEYLIVCDVDF